MTDWSAWRYDRELIAHYTIRIRGAFRAALQDSAKLIDAWWNGSLPMTRQGLVDLISELIEKHVGKVLHSLWEEAWWLGSRSADIAIHAKHPDFDGWKPGESAAARVADEAGLRHLLHAVGPSFIRSIATTRMQHLTHEIGKAARHRKPKKLIAKLEDILHVSARAPMIAETEASRALSAAAMDHYRRAGIPMKQWVISHDRVCQTCIDNAAEGPIPFTVPFHSGMMGPPQHPNCRCAVVPAKKSEKSRGPKRNRPQENDYHSEPGLDMRGSPSQPPNPGGGGVGMGAPSGTVRLGDGNGSEAENAYGTSRTQRPGTSANSDNAGGEPPRFTIDEVDQWEPGAVRQIDENGQEHWFVVRRHNTSEWPHPSRYADEGLPGGAPEGPSIGTEQPQGDPFMSPQPHGRYPRAAQDGDYPQGRGRPPNAVGKEATLSKEQARYRRARDWRRCGNCAMFEGSTCDLVKGIISKSFVCDYWLHMVQKSGKKRPKAAGIAVRAKDTGRVLMLQRDFDDPENKNSGKWEWPGGRLDEDETPLQAACREWCEETGLKMPDGVIIGNWLSPDGRYEGFVLEIEHEDELPILGRRKADPDGGSKETLAWFEPDQIKDNPSVRSQIRDDWTLIHIALRGIKYAVPGREKTKPEK